MKKIFPYTFTTILLVSSTNAMMAENQIVNIETAPSQYQNSTSIYQSFPNSYQLEDTQTTLQQAKTYVSELLSDQYLLSEEEIDETLRAWNTAENIKQIQPILETEEDYSSKLDKDKCKDKDTPINYNTFKEEIQRNFEIIPDILDKIEEEIMKTLLFCDEDPCKPEPPKIYNKIYNIIRSIINTTSLPCNVKTRYPTLSILHGFEYEVLFKIFCENMSFKNVLNDAITDSIDRVIKQDLVYNPNRQEIKNPGVLAFCFISHNPYKNSPLFEDYHIKLKPTVEYHKPIYNIRSFLKISALEQIRFYYNQKHDENGTNSGRRIYYDNKHWFQKLLYPTFIKYIYIRDLKTYDLQIVKFNARWYEIIGHKIDLINSDLHPNILDWIEHTKQCVEFLKKENIE